MDANTWESLVNLVAADPEVVAAWRQLASGLAANVSSMDRRSLGTLDVTLARIRPRQGSMADGCREAVLAMISGALHQVHMRDVERRAVSDAETTLERQISGSIVDADLIKENWRRVLAALQTRSARPSQVMKHTGLKSDAVSKVLRSLQKQGLVEAIDLESAAEQGVIDKRASLYRLTARGEAVALRHTNAPIPSAGSSTFTNRLHEPAKILKGGKTTYGGSLSRREVKSGQVPVVRRHKFKKIAVYEPAPVKKGE